MSSFMRCYVVAQSSWILLSWILLLRGCYGAEVKSPSSCDSYPCLIFHDDFDRLDFKVWEHLITRWHTGNEEFQYYTNNRLVKVRGHQSNFLDFLSHPFEIGQTDPRLNPNAFWSNKVARGHI